MLVVVSGGSCTGKTTVSAELSRRLRCPAMRKDDFKELLADTLGCDDLERSRLLGATAWELVFQTADSLLPFVPCLLVEGNFHGRGASTLRELVARHRVGAVEVHCRTEFATWSRRVIERTHGGERHPAHFDAVRLLAVEELRPGRDAEPAGLGGTLIEVDTTDFSSVDFDAIAAAVDRSSWDR